MCAVGATQLSGVESPTQVIPLDSTTPVGTSDEGSSTLSSVAEDEEISDVEPPVTKSSKVKIMCSYGGRILPRPQDNQLRYVGGETRILVVKKGIKYRDLMGKLFRLGGRNVVLKYQLPNEDLDALISVKSDEDVCNMMEEHEKVESRSSDGGLKLRAFLFFDGTKNPLEESSNLKKSPSFAPVGVHQKAKLPRIHSAEWKFVQTAPPGHQVHDPSGFGSLKAYQDQQQQQQGLETVTCDCSRCSSNSRTRNYFQETVPVEHLQIPHHHHHPHQESLTCKGCYINSDLAARHQRINFGHHHPHNSNNNQYPHTNQHHFPMRTNHSKLHYQEQSQLHHKRFKSPDYSSILPGTATAYPYYQQLAHHLR